MRSSRATRKAGVQVAIAIALAVVAICVASLAPASPADAAAPVVISPTGVIHTPTPTIQVRFIGTTVSTWFTTTVYNPQDISIKIDGVPVQFTRSPAGDAYEVTCSAAVTEPLSPGLHSIWAYSSTGSDFWTFEYLPDPDATHSPIVDVWPFGDTSGFTWDSKVGFSLIPGTLEASTTVASLAIDGITYPVTASFGYYSTAVLTQISGSPGYYVVTPLPPATLGEHTATASVSDGQGRVVTRTWSYVVNRPPVIAELSPADGSLMNPTDTAISATVTDEVGGVDPDSVSMTVNGVAVVPECEVISQGEVSLTYVPDTPFESDTDVEVVLSVKDTYGATTTNAWTFNVSDAAPPGLWELSVNGTCKGCHGSDFNVLHIDMDAVYTLSHDLPSTPRNPSDAFTNCIWCHQTLDTKVNNPGVITDFKWDENYPAGGFFTMVQGRWCEMCHINPGPNPYTGEYEPYSANWKYRTHGWSSEFSRSDLPAGSTIQTPREPMDCVYCHQQGQAAPFTVGPHDVLGDHRIELSADCRTCHSPVLASEHAAGERVDATGAPVVCDTCHQSADTAVSSVSGKRWLGSTDRWEVEFAGPYTSGIAPPVSQTFGPWSYQRDGAIVPVDRIKVRLKGTGGAVLEALCSGTWTQVLSVAARNTLSGSSVTDPDVVHDIAVPGATAFRWRLTYTRNQAYRNGIRAGLTVMETDPGRPDPTCGSCHPEAEVEAEMHRSAHDESLLAMCTECHEGNLVGEHVGDELTCRSCHASASARVAGAIAGTDGSCRACHDASSENHPHPASAVGTSTVEFDALCSDCHSADLVAEHAKSTSAGHEDACASCHGSTDARVQTAITAGGGACGGCHDGAGHETEHVSGLDSRCADCHGSGLTITHITPPDATTLKQQYACTTCHPGSGSSAAVAFSARACGVCHDAAHAQTVVTTTTADVFLDPRIAWSQSLPAALFAGETWMPAGALASDGRVAVGGRTALSVAEVWSAFESQMGADGWTHQVAAPGAEDVTFAGVLFKNDQRCQITIYAGDSRGATSPSGTGARAEVVWWSVSE